jgi:predicted AlkP superfamily phosphohydrolase/phosphomutase
LVEHKYLVHPQQGGKLDLKGVDWNESLAYALGLNSLYLNLQDRESEGIVSPNDRSKLIQRLKEELLQWKGPDGTAIIQRVLDQEEAFQGPLAAYGPDLIIGYNPGYRASAETGLGQWSDNAIEINKDHWNADHCFDAEAVPGVLFSNRGLENLSQPSFADIPSLAIGKSLSPSDSTTPPSYSDEDQDAVEKRLKDLGYL